MFALYIQVPGLGSNVQDNSKMTPLMWSAYYGQTQNIEVLKKRGAGKTRLNVHIYCYHHVRSSVLSL